MLSVFDSFRDLNIATVIFRMLVATLCGAAIGFERSYRNRPAGLRTHMLVCVGCATAAMTGLFLYLNLRMPGDVSRMGAQVISGLGFLGAGTIIVTKKNTIIGLTTAAGLWTAGIIGLAAGSGYYEGAIATTVLVLVTETLFFYFGKNIPRISTFKTEIRYEKKTDLDKVLRFIKDNKLSIANLHIEVEGVGDMAIYKAVITIHAPKRKDRKLLIARINAMQGIISAEEKDSDDAD